MLLTSVLKSSACYMAIGLIFTLLVFPESMNHAVLSGIHGQLSLLTVLLRMQESVLSGGYKSEEVKGKMKGLGRKSVDVYKQLQGAIGMLTLEVSVGRWSAEDVKELFDPLGAVVARMGKFSFFAHHTGRAFLVVPIGLFTHLHPVFFLSWFTDVRWYRFCCQ